MTLAKHIPALQILLPFFAALFTALSYNKFASWVIATTCLSLCLGLAIYALPLAKEGISYAFGGWEAPIGIEYHLDYLNQPVIIYINGVLLFFLIFGKELINITIIKYIDDKQQHLFYSLLLFAHVGYLGVISTNDLFNIYVFIEISSLATYVLMSKGSDPKSLIGAFDYLTLGTIGATLILIGIGFLLALTGSLNISDVAEILRGQYSSRIAITAIVFFLTGAILKTAFFPMHFWMMRAYSAAPPFILTYLASISTIFGIYIIIRFMHFAIEGELFHEPISLILRPLALATIIIWTFLAIRAKNLKDLVIYSTASQIGYVFLLLTIWEGKEIMFQLLVLDGINKIALFSLVAHIQNKTDNLNFDNFKFIEDRGLFKTLSAFIIIFSAGLPLTSMFIVKVKMLDLLSSHNLVTEFIVVILSFVFSLLYHFKLVKAIFFTSKTNGTINISTKHYGLLTIVVIQVLTLLYINPLARMASYTTDSILAS